MKGKSWSANLFFVQTQKYRPKHICQQTCSEILLDCRTFFGHFQIFSTRKWSGNINQHSVLSRNFTSERKRREDKGARGCMGDCRKADISTYNPLRPRSHRVGGQKQYIFTPLRNKIHFHAKSFQPWPPWKPSDTCGENSEFQNNTATQLISPETASHTRSFFSISGYFFMLSVNGSRIEVKEIFAVVN